MIVDVRNDADFGTLSNREAEILGLATQGLLDKQISEKLDVSLNTLRTYWARIRQKIGDLPRPALVALFMADKVRAQHGEAPQNPFANSIIVDAESGMALATDDINERMGYPLGEHRPFSDYSGTLHPDDRPTGVAAMEKLFRGEEDIVHLVFREVNKVGILTINATLIALRDEGGRVRWVYAQGLELADCRPPEDTGFMIGHWVRRYPEEELLIDEGMAKIFGYGDVATVTLDAYRNSVPREEHEAVQRELEQALAERRTELHREMRFTAYDGVPRFGRSYRKLVYNDDGTVDIYGEIIVFE